MEVWKYGSPRTCFHTSTLPFFTSSPLIDGLVRRARAAAAGLFLHRRFEVFGEVLIHGGAHVFYPLAHGLGIVFDVPISHLIAEAFQRVIFGADSGEARDEFGQFSSSTPRAG